MPKKPDFSVVHFTDSDDYRVLEEDTQEFVCRATNMQWAYVIALALTLNKRLKEDNHFDLINHYTLSEEFINQIADNTTPEQD
jgi:hypothetical protein